MTQSRKEFSLTITLKMGQWEQNDIDLLSIVLIRIKMPLIIPRLANLESAFLEQEDLRKIFRYLYLYIYMDIQFYYFIYLLFTNNTHYIEKKSCFFNCYLMILGKISCFLFYSS